MVQPAQALQAFRRELATYTHSIVRTAFLSSLTLHEVEGKAFKVSAAWEGSKPGSYEKTYTYDDVFAYTGLRSPRLKKPMCQHWRGLAREILTSRGL
jgi:hypothetical protein